MARNKTKIGDNDSASEIFRFQKIRFEGLRSVRKRGQFPLGQSMGGYSACGKKLKTQFSFSFSRESNFKICLCSYPDHLPLSYVIK